jgi:hypothetical protein
MRPPSGVDFLAVTEQLRLAVFVFDEVASSITTPPRSGSPAAYATNITSSCS